MPTIHSLSSSFVAVVHDDDDSSTSTDLQIKNKMTPVTCEGDRARLTSPNTLHKTLIEIAQQSLTNTNNANVYAKFNRCKNEHAVSDRIQRKKTSFSPRTIEFEKQPSKSELQLEEELLVFWEAVSPSVDPHRLHVLTQFGARRSLANTGPKHKIIR